MAEPSFYYYKKDVMPYSYSDKVRGRFKFDICRCIIPKRENGIYNTHLVIGYNNNNYVLIRNSKINLDNSDKTHVPLILIDKGEVEKDWREVKRPIQGILKKPKVDDKVLFVFKERYMGVGYGDIKNVDQMPGRRLAFKGKNYDHKTYSNTATYESKYFVVIGSNSEYNMDEVWIDVEMTTDIEKARKKNNKVNSSGLTEEKEECPREVLETEDIIVRKAIEETSLEVREVYDARLIERQH